MTANDTAPTIGQEASKHDNAILALLLLAALVVFAKDITVGGFRFSDGATHAMDGVLIHDWILAGPQAWIHPMDFAIRQYARYPTLGMAGTYPPGFAVVESGFFAIFGISVFTARLCALCFGLAAVAGCYRLARRFLTPTGAACATAALIGMPGVVLWARQTMLEMPALAVIIWSVHASLSYFDKPTRTRLVVASVLIVAAPLFKQNAIFIVPLLGVLMLIRAARGQVPVKHVLAATLLVALPLTAIFGYTMLVQGAGAHTARTISKNRSLGDFFSWWSLTYYLRRLPREAGVAVLILCSVGLVTWLRHLRRIGFVYASWFGLVYVMTVIIQYKEPRYFYFALLPVALLAGLGGEQILAAVRSRRVRSFAGTIAATLLVMVGYRTPTPLNPDYSDMIAAYEPQLRNKLVIFDGHRDGDFVFAARRVLGPEASVIVRGSKVFYTCSSTYAFDFKSLVSTTTEIENIIDDLGCETVFVERIDNLEIKEMQLLRTLLEDTDRYDAIGSPVLRVPDATGPARSVAIDVYRKKGQTIRRKRFVNIPIPLLGKSIRIDLDDLMEASPRVSTPNPT
jgi:Dolichyl-phosphate-mannose-protein mannosyltransferase